MKAFQCSVCANLYDMDKNCACSVGIDPRPKYRDKGDAELCRENFEKLEPQSIWHEKFHWE